MGTFRKIWTRWGRNWSRDESAKIQEKRVDTDREWREIDGNFRRNGLESRYNSARFRLRSSWIEATLNQFTFLMGKRNLLSRVNQEYTERCWAYIKNINLELRKISWRLTCGIRSFTEARHRHLGTKNNRSIPVLVLPKNLEDVLNRQSVMMLKQMRKRSNIWIEHIFGKFCGWKEL